MIDDKDMIDINLNSTLIQLQNNINELGLREREQQQQQVGLHKSFSINDLKEHETRKNSKFFNLNHIKYATISGIKNKPAKLDEPNISCLRQMYCPECHQRLDADSVRFETLLQCCLPLFPLQQVYQCCLKRSIGRKVICNKCGNNLGYWKRS